MICIKEDFDLYGNGNFIMFVVLLEVTIVMCCEWGDFFGFVSVF